MFESTFSRLAICIIVAIIPIAIWLFVIFNKAEKSKKIMLLVFGLGCLTAPALLGLQILWDDKHFPQLNLVRFIETHINNPMAMNIAILLLFAAMEELIKLYVMRTVDKKTILITRVSDAMRFAIASALGFSFTENIYYLYSYWPQIGTGELVQMFIFRSVFTTAAHMVYSGIFGYYYGVSKFSMVVNKQKSFTGGYDKVGSWIAKIFGLPPSEGFREKLILIGLITAISMHFTVNFLLDLSETKNWLKLVVIAFNVLTFLYLQYLLNRKAGHLILLTDPSVKRAATIAKKDEDVVIELLAMWFQDKRYVDVMHICERLLERDPDNEVVQLFKAKAMDSMEDKDTYKKILGNVLTGISPQNVISRYIDEKEMQAKAKQMIKLQLKKEGKEFKEDKKPPIEEKKEEKTNIVKAPKSNNLEQFTGQGTFKL